MYMILKKKYSRILSRYLSRTIKTKNEIEYENKLWKVEFDSYLHNKTVPIPVVTKVHPYVRHSSLLKCFQIMNIQIVKFDCYLHERTVPILPSSVLIIKKNQMAVRFYFRILSRFLHRTIKIVPIRSSVANGHLTACIEIK